MPLFCYTNDMPNPKRDSHDELLDLVDDQGNIVGQEMRSSVYKKKHKWFRLAEIVVRNGKGEIFIMTRDKVNPMMPGMKETVGEHIHAGESDLASARRAVKEELGIDVPALQFQFLGYTAPTEGTVGYCSVFLAETSAEPRLNHEHQDGSWMSPEQIMTMMRENPLQFRSNVRVLFAKFARQIFAK